MKKETTIRPHQIAILQTLLAGRFKDREGRLHFVSSFIGRELPSTKNLTEGEFFSLADYLGYDFKRYARFDRNNGQHLYLLSTCYNLGWREERRWYTDLQRLGKWFCSSRNPFKKSLQSLTPEEVAVVNSIFEKMLRNLYAKQQKKA